MTKVLRYLLLLWVFTLASCFRHSGDTEGLPVGKRIQLTSAEDLYQFLTYDDNRYPLVSLHRGGPSSGYPENALETFAYNASLQPVIVECDVRLSKDSALVLMHDNTLDRTTTGHGAVKSLTLAELKKLRLVDNNKKITPYKIPTLDEALAWGKGKVIFTLDIKNDVPYESVINAIRKQRAESSVVIITYSAGQASKVHNLAGDLMISASVKNLDDLVRLSEKDIPDNRLLAFVGSRETDPQLTKILHDHGIMCILGTQGNLDRQATKKGFQIYAGFIDRGADILSTDRPTEAGRALNFYIKKRGITSKFVQ
ncbi:glycerophosphodiester phosphodiesterase family protein [Sphingobacterium thalpophilum]|uniref:Glycerophosphodiester phosphodiesterase family protein n=1 Tax=Sphingobacterium thalpophilum TaxID=259 RepID=A0A4V6KR87_9SPHI|nr:glycerophosphodiester phosphodiesterase family protein [Sphingobacterium thalpophilum]VTR41918.1 Glycerophosphoryl diester phosphodiesterase [Sphingobacterium thalpophilum]